MKKAIVGMSLKNYINLPEESVKLASAIQSVAEEHTQEAEIFILPSIGTLESVAEQLSNTKLGFGAQNISPKSNGAYTGEYSIETLDAIGGQYVEIGHFERRNYFNETDAMIKQKVELSLSFGMTAILCVGERDENLTYSELYTFLEGQLVGALQNINVEDADKLIIAYEPGWSIGKEQAAPNSHVWKTHEIIYTILKNNFDDIVANSIRLIYGGSVSKENAYEITKSDHVDGVFVGRFGHKPENFETMVKAVLKNKAKGG